MALWCVKVTVTVDGSDFPKTLMSELQLMSGSYLLVGGAENPANITHSIMRNNFYGTIDKVGGRTALFGVLFSPFSLC